MVADSIEREVLIEAPPSVVWRVITEPGYIRQWFIEVDELDLRPGGDGALTAPDSGNTFPIVVQEVEPERLLSWRWVHPEGSEPRAGNSTLVAFTLTPEGEHTRLRVTESGYNELGWEDRRRIGFVEAHERGWDEYIAKLVVVAAAAALASRA